MFEKFKTGWKEKAIREAKQEFRRSSNEGRIHTAGIAFGGVLFLGYLLLSHHEQDHAASQPKIEIHVHNYIYKEDESHEVVRQDQERMETPHATRKGQTGH